MLPQFYRVLKDGKFGRNIYGVVRMIQESKEQHRQDRTDGAERNQAEAVVLGVLVASDCGKAHAHGHDKRNRHRPGGDAAGVKGDGKEVLGHEECQDEYENIAYDQQGRQRP